MEIDEPEGPAGDEQDSVQHNAELLALHRADQKAVALQQKGQYIEALACMERGLVLRQHFFGVDSKEVRAAAGAGGVPTPGRARRRHPASRPGRDSP